MKHVLYFISSQVAQFSLQNESAVLCLAGLLSGEGGEGVLECE